MKFSFFWTDQLVDISQSMAAHLHESCPVSPQIMAILGKIGTVTEEDLNVFNVEKMEEGPIVEPRGTDDKDLSVEEIIQILKDEYDVEQRVAEACLGILHGEEPEKEVGDYFEWCLENHDSEEVIEEGILNYRSSANVEEKNAVPTATLGQFTEEAIKRTENQVNLKSKLNIIWNSFLNSIETEETSDFINLERLGEGLETLYRKKLRPVNRKFPLYLSAGKPNLIYSDAENIHQTCLTIYNHDSEAPLPGIDEVLLVRENTSAEDVELLCRRAFNDEEDNKIYCLMYAEKLGFVVTMKVENLLINSEIKNRNYRLVFICCKDRSSNHYSYMATALDKYKADVPKFPRGQLQKYVYRNLMRGDSKVDPTRTRIVLSSRAGNGKSLACVRAAARINYDRIQTTLYDTVVNIEELLEWMSERSTTNNNNTLFHIDLASDLGSSKNDLMFSLSILRGLEDKNGRVWRCNRIDVYMFESTMEKKSRGFFQLLPQTICLSPQGAYDELQTSGVIKLQSLVQKAGSPDLHQICDDRMFQSDVIQRPAQYLLRFHEGEDLDKFTYSPTNNMLDQKRCLEILQDNRSCPVKDPTFSELMNFAKFLNYQLQECEKSIFCQLGGTEDWKNLRFKNLVVKFLILMTQDFSTRSLEISDQSSLDQPTIIERRRWESSHHPYIFFNEDSTITFFGIKIDRTLSLLDPNDKVIEKNIMHQNLYHLLREQNRNDKIPIFIPNNFDSLSDDIKLRTLCRILGVERENVSNMKNIQSAMKDPDSSYKLTADNVKKLLATYMRMRAGIPVVIMGETGCGKTRMIKYLCDILKARKRCKNIILMKVHGGLSKKTINQKVEEALKVANENYHHYNVKMTVMFFDEANTTSWIHLIKDIVVDRINNGKALPEDSTLQFAICVNPYRKHSADMIKKLENSGLGYHIQAKQTSDRIGEVPLRQLVYRVHPLPISLFPFVWDFGQPSENDEREMILQMVRNTRVVDQQTMTLVVNCICRSQIFLRKCSFESSFVSLRDVDRLLRIFNFFDNNKHLFEEKLVKEAELPITTVSLLLALGLLTVD